MTASDEIPEIWKPGDLAFLWLGKWLRGVFTSVHFRPSPSLHFPQHSGIVVCIHEGVILVHRRSRRCSLSLQNLLGTISLFTAKRFFVRVTEVYKSCSFSGFMMRNVKDSKMNTRCDHVICSKRYKYHKKSQLHSSRV